MKEELDCSHDDIEVESAIPLIKENDNWVVHAERVRTLAEWSRASATVLFMAISLVTCFVFYMTCQPCLFGVLVISACLCPWFNAMNAPLWLSIILLVVGGWTFTTGYFSLTWNSGIHM
jgi:hypothetical protein